MSPREQLTEPLLAAEERTGNNNDEGGHMVPAAAADLEACPDNDHDHYVGGEGGGSSPSSTDGDDTGFSVKAEILEMFNLGFPLAISFCKFLSFYFFCTVCKRATSLDFQYDEYLMSIFCL